MTPVLQQGGEYYMIESINVICVYRYYNFTFFDTFVKMVPKF